MGNPIKGLNKVFESRVRLGVMAMLMVEESVEYNTLKAQLNLTDGNLASHIKALEKEEFIKVEKSFFERKPNTKYRATRAGIKAFEAHIDAIEKLIQNLR